jgi:hypothetical protein
VTGRHPRRLECWHRHAAALADALLIPIFGNGLAMAHSLDVHGRLDDRRAARLTAAFASVGAAVVHLAVLPAHLREWWPAGAFFAAIAAFQLGWPVLVALRPTRWLLASGVLVNAGSIALWAVSRTAGIPAGPAAGIAEPITRVGVLTEVLEVIVSVSALWWLYRGSARSFRSAPAYLSSVGGAVLVVAALTAGAVTGTAGGHGHGTDSHEGQRRDIGHGGGGQDEQEPLPPERTRNPAPAGPAETGTRSGDEHEHEHGSR